MFKSWSKKNKIKAVFKLQFQVTQVPKLKKSALMISLVPDDVGKPTVKLEKTAVEDGICYWENPVYETVRLVREPKTGKINEKIYHFVVSTGSSKSGFLGEASIDFADFEAEAEPLTVSLPLKFANSGAILHVTIQKIESDTKQRGGEENGAPILTHERSFDSQLSYSDSDGNQISAENGQLYSSYESVEQTRSTRQNSLNYEENTQQPPGFRKYNEHDPPTSLSQTRQSSMPRKETADATGAKNHAHRRTNTDWSLGSISDGSFGDSTNSFEDNPLKEKLQEIPDDTFEKLKDENAALIRQVEVSQLELQSLRKQVAKETTQGQTLSRQIISLTEERDTLKTECKQLKYLKKCNDEAEDSKTLQSKIKDARVQLEAVREEIKHEKELRTNLELQLQKTQESNSELMLAVRDLEEMVELKNRVIADLSSNVETCKNHEIQGVNNLEVDSNGNERTSGELVKEHVDVKEIESMKQKIRDMNGEMNIYMNQRDELEKHIEQLTMDYDNLKQENHDISMKLKENKIQDMTKQNEHSDSLAIIKELESQVEKLEEKIRKQAQEFSESLISINELEAEVKGLEKELEMQAHRFNDDFNAMELAKVEQENRAIRAEDALRNTRWKNAVTAERLQEEFKKLSEEMASKFDDNKKETMKACTEASELRQQKRDLEEMLRMTNEELRLIKYQSVEKLNELSDQLDSKAKQVKQILTELDEKTQQLESAQKHEERRQEEIQTLKSKIERLTTVNENLTRHGERGILIETWSSERFNSEKKVDSEEAHEELMRIRVLISEKDKVIENLLSEMENLRTKHNELETVSYKEQVDKANLWKQISQLRDELQMKEEIITRTEKKLKHLSEETAASDVSFSSANNVSEPLLHNPTKIAALTEKIQMLEDDIRLKEAALESSTNSFLAIENKLFIRVKELERSMEIIGSSQSSVKENTSAENIITNTSEPEEEYIRGSPLHSERSKKQSMSFQKEKSVTPNDRILETCSDKELILPTNKESKFTDLLTEVSLLTEKNRSMERELKEMSERYSEISLKFAEVEGERQQLVMTVRNLKNGKKN